MICMKIVFITITLILGIAGNDVFPDVRIGQKIDLGHDKMKKLYETDLKKFHESFEMVKNSNISTVCENSLAKIFSMLGTPDQFNFPYSFLSNQGEISITKL